MAKVGRTIRGFGDYSVKHNTIMEGGMSPPMITNSVVTGGVILRHREYLRDINAAIDFTSQQYPVNPGITATFPWLSQIATSFEQYKFRGLVFEFKSMAADVVLSSAASTALGTVIMGTKYNVLEQPFTNKFEMENWEYTSSCKPSSSMFHPIECAASQTPVDMLYIRNSNVTQGAIAGDLRLYDLCNFNIAVQGMQNTGGLANGSIGELWATYEIELYKPKLEEDISTQSAHFDEHSRSVGGTYALVEPTNAIPLGNYGTAPVGTAFYPGAGSNSTLPCFIIPQGGSLYPPTADAPGGLLVITDSIAKRVLISLTTSWSAGITAPTSFVGPLIFNSLPSQGWRGINNWVGDTVSQIGAFQASPGTPTTGNCVCIFQSIIELTSDLAVIPFGNYTWASTFGGPNFIDLWITELGPNAQ